ncbi:MAG TPA: PQQ-dependent sugar dehydrogenase [Terriglobales bacterium]|jgi:glucose/arabinose dehydrogenase|nr:PQQ-dependent sugar dehydrogenase [Terriglobales bacterium]
MFRIFRVLLFLPLIIFLPSCGGSGSPTPPPPGPVAIALSTVVSGLSSPLDLETPDDSSGRSFVVEQGGTIRIIKSGSLVSAPFLDISTKVVFNGEMGLLGIAFHPNFAADPRFYVNYVRDVSGQKQTVISEYQVQAGNSDLADPASERILLTVNQPFGNHKGGQLAFGPDGFLYIGLGDGGGEGDPLGNGQKLNTLLGKMLRIDVDHTDSGRQYAIPSDNPFVGSGGLPEIWAYGFRNPWRFSFDRSSNRLFVGDVGQDNYEEVDIGQKGANFGWNIMEGAHCFNPPIGCDMTGLILPIIEYAHPEGETVIGGFVYRGSALPALAGSYVFGDFTGGQIWSAAESSGTWNRTILLSTSRSISSFGEDAAGELYLVDYSGSVLKIVPQ